jgi:phytanoyl-CoA hydroxylase
MTLHGSPENISGLPRRGLVFQFRAADAYQLADNLWEDGGLLVRGQRSPHVRLEAGVLVLPRFNTNNQRWGPPPPRT